MELDFKDPFPVCQKICIRYRDWTKARKYKKYKNV